VRFDYYGRLSATDRRTYDKSDAVARIVLPMLSLHRANASALEVALRSEDRAAVAKAAQVLVTGITRALGVSNVAVKVLAKRPKNRAGELHGLYTLERDGRARIEVWMRTAEQRKVVRFRTFLRTLLHEVCHHLDFTWIGLRDTFHTDGFFRRESSLVRQISPAPAPARSSTPRPERTRPKASQLSLFD
jgi:hypothetical protein